MPIHFPRLDPNLIITTAVEGPTSVKPVEAIKQDVIQKLIQVGVGKHLQGEVIAKLRDGSFLAYVDGEPMHLALPAETQVGNKLSLTLLQLTPRPVFLLNGQHQVAVLPSPRELNPNTVASNVQQAMVQQSNVQIGVGKSTPDLFTESGHMQTHQNSLSIPNTSPNSTQAFKSHFAQNREFASQFLTKELSSKTDLSTTGQLINKLLNEFSDTHATLSIQGNKPLLSENLAKYAPEQIASQLEKALRHSIDQSGLFYESHVAQWAAGKRSKEALQNEPQAQIALSQEDTVLTDQNSSEHANLTQIIQQQLHVLEHQKLHWSGLLTPGIKIDWRIEESPSDEQSPLPIAAEVERNWHSYLRVNLPTLGVVTIDMNLKSEQLRLQVFSQNEGSLHALQSHYDDLRSAIEKTGTQIQMCAIKQHEQS